MFAFTKLVRPFLLPPGIFVVALLLSALWFFLSKNWKAAIVNLLMGSLMWVLSLAPVGDAILSSLEYDYTIPAQIQGDVIIVLGNGVYDEVPDLSGIGIPTEEAVGRLTTAARLYRELKIPVIVSGGKVFGHRAAEAPILRRFLVELGVPPGQVTMEIKSRTTFENAKYTREICEELEFRNPVLVTSAYHMPRAVWSFKKNGMNVTPLPTNFKTWQNRDYGGRGFLPRSFRAVYLGMKEYLGIWFYKLAY
jgi:uncharacterized SAM-binding protein YcdF (DUF218 family)